MRTGRSLGLGLSATPFACSTLLTLVLGGCGSTPQEPEGIDADGAPDMTVDIEAVPDAVPRTEPLSRYGNPESYEVYGKRYHTLKSSADYLERGIASWYGTKFHGKRTSSGEPYDMFGMTAAHKTLPLPTYVRVTELSNGKSVVLKVNDRGPFHDNRIIDLSYVAAAKLGILAEGTGLVEVRALDANRPEATPTTIAEGSASPFLYLQVGAFGSRYNADRLRSRLAESLKESIRVQQVDSGGQKIFRVQVGPMTSVESTDELALQLSQLGYADLHVVVE